MELQLWKLFSVCFRSWVAGCWKMEALSSELLNKDRRSCDKDKCWGTSSWVSVWAKKYMYISATTEMFLNQMVKLKWLNVFRWASELFAAGNVSAKCHSVATTLMLWWADHELTICILELKELLKKGNDPFSSALFVFLCSSPRALRVCSFWKSTQFEWTKRETYSVLTVPKYLHNSKVYILKESAQRRALYSEGTTVSLPKHDLAHWRKEPWKFLHCSENVQLI